jgi:hypothetical protein
MPMLTAPEVTWWWTEVATMLEVVTLANTDPEFDAWKAAYEGRTEGPVSHQGRWYVPRDRQRQRAPRGAQSAYKFYAQVVAAPAHAALPVDADAPQAER